MKILNDELDAHSLTASKRIRSIDYLTLTLTLKRRFAWKEDSKAPERKAITLCQMESVKPTMRWTREFLRQG